MLLVFWIIFSVPVISQIESIGGGQAGGGWEASSSSVPSVWDTDW